MRLKLSADAKTVRENCFEEIVNSWLGSNLFELLTTSRVVSFIIIVFANIIFNGFFKNDYLIVFILLVLNLFNSYSFAGFAWNKGSIYKYGWRMLFKLVSSFEIFALLCFFLSEELVYTNDVCDGYLFIGVIVLLVVELLAGSNLIKIKNYVRKYKDCSLILTFILALQPFINLILYFVAFFGVIKL